MERYRDGGRGWDRESVAGFIKVQEQQQPFKNAVLSSHGGFLRV